MGKDQILGLVRQVLTFLGMYLVAQGIGNEGLIVEAVGALMTVTMTIWGWVDKSNRQLSVWLSMTRHFLSALGGFILSYGLIPEDLWNDIVSVTIGIISITLSQIENRKKATV